MNFVTPILLAGGSGERLWPSSSKVYPKQFLKFMGNETLFQQTALRFSNSELVKFSPPITITNSQYQFIVGEQLQNIRIVSGPVLIEPKPKNTAAAILAGTIFALKGNKNPIIIVTPSDHIISDNKYLHRLIKIGVKAVNEGNIVTFGITPTYPETGYGYLQIEKNGTNDLYKVIRFIEKPDHALAKVFFKEDNYLWNSGIFMFRATDMISAFDTYAKEILFSVEKSIEMGTKDKDFVRLDPKTWNNIEDISIDYAIMEKIKNLVVIPFFSKWSDLGNWDSVWKEMNKDSNGVALSKNAYALDCKNSLLRSENKKQNIVGLGLQDIVAVATPDAVLVAHKNKSQNIKKVVQYLKSKNVNQSEKLKKNHHSWGSHEILSLGAGFQIKKIFIKPSGVLSLENHKYLSEHWVVVKGIAKFTIDDKIRSINEGQSINISLGIKHRIENEEKKTIIIIKIQIGCCLD